MFVMHLQQLSGLASGRFALHECEVDERSALRNSLLEPADGCRVECFAFEFEHRFLMCGGPAPLPAILAAPLACDLGSAVQNTNGRVRSDERQRAAHCLRWNGVVVEIETHIDGLA